MIRRREAGAHRQHRHRTRISQGDAAALRQGAGGGRNGSGDYLESAELYDPATGTWSSTGSLDTTRFFTRRRCCQSGKVLVAGGLGDWFAINGTEFYDPDTATP